MNREKTEWSEEYVRRHKKRCAAALEALNQEVISLCESEDFSRAYEALNELLNGAEVFFYAGIGDMKAFLAEYSFNAGILAAFGCVYERDSVRRASAIAALEYGKTFADEVPSERAEIVLRLLKSNIKSDELMKALFTCFPKHLLKWRSKVVEE